MGCRHCVTRASSGLKHVESGFSGWSSTSCAISRISSRYTGVNAANEDRGQAADPVSPLLSTNRQPILNMFTSSRSRRLVSNLDGWCLLSLSSLARNVLSATCAHPREPCASASLAVSVRWGGQCFFVLGTLASCLALHVWILLGRLPDSVLDAHSFVWGG